MRRREFLQLATIAQLPPAERVVAVGDVHGDLDRFIDVLSMAGLVRDGAEWSGGRAVLVQLGDVVDRGARSCQVIDFLIKLEKQAARAGGAVHVLLGNHEAMRMYGDFHDVAPAEFQSFVTPKSERERDKLYDQELARQSASGDLRHRQDLSLNFRSRWEKDHPLGQAELARAFAPKGQYGKWILERPVLLRKSETLFVHAGISPKYSEWSETRFQNRMHEELLQGSRLGNDAVCRDAAGPLWWRGFATDSDAVLEPHVNELLARHQVRRIIAGHTPTANGVASRLGGKVILADVGLSEAFSARRACVVLEGGAIYALDRGQKTQLK